MIIHGGPYGESRLLLNGEVEEYVGDGQWVRVSNVEKSLSLILDFVASLHEVLINAGLAKKPNMGYSLPGNGHHPRCVYYSEDSYIDEGD